MMQSEKNLCEKKVLFQERMQFFDQCFEMGGSFSASNFLRKNLSKVA